MVQIAQAGPCNNRRVSSRLCLEIMQHSGIINLDIQVLLLKKVRSINKKGDALWIGHKVALCEKLLKNVFDKFVRT